MDPVIFIAGLATSLFARFVLGLGIRDKRWWQFIALTGVLFVFGRRLFF